MKRRDCNSTAIVQFSVNCHVIELSNTHTLSSLSLLKSQVENN